MEVFPIIYSRTYYMDYAPDFYVCPSVFDNNTIEKFRGYIMETLQYPNMIRDIRKVTISENGYTVFGYACELAELIKRKEKKLELLSYTRDVKNRGVVSFLGIAIRNGELTEKNIPDNIDEVIYNLFDKYIVDDEKWLHKEINHYVENSFEISVMEYKRKNNIQGKLVCHNKRIYFSNADNDNELFLQIMSKSGREKKLNYCSDYYGIESVKDSRFNIITSRYIEKIRKCFETEVQECNLHEKRHRDSLFLLQKKTNKVVFVTACVVIFLIIIIGICISERLMNK